jgi:type IV pilus assembly protein PilM
MNLDQIVERLMPVSRKGGVAFTLPPAVLEVQPGFVAGARIERKRKNQRRLRRTAFVRFDPHAIQPSIGRANVVDSEAVRDALRRVTEIIGVGDSRFALLVPDAAVRVSLVSFETIPSKAQEFEALLCWRIKDNLPFSTDEVRLSYQENWKDEKEVEILVLAAKTDVMAEYEAELGAAAVSSVLVLPSSVALLPLIPENGDEAQLLMHLCGEWVTSVVVSGKRVRFWRTRQFGPDLPGGMDAHIIPEAARAFASMRDRFDIDIATVWLASRPRAAEELASTLQTALGLSVRELPGLETYGTGLPAGEQEAFLNYGAPVAGLLHNVEAAPAA